MINILPVSLNNTQKEHYVLDVSSHIPEAIISDCRMVFASDGSDWHQIRIFDLHYHASSFLQVCYDISEHCMVKDCDGVVLNACFNAANDYPLKTCYQIYDDLDEYAKKANNRLPFYWRSYYYPIKMKHGDYYVAASIGFLPKSIDPDRIFFECDSDTTGNC